MYPKAEALWHAYLQTLPDAAEATQRFYEVFHIGNTPNSADAGADLILRGIKTTTSSLLWEYDATNKPRPYEGALNIVEDGRGAPVCIVETVMVEIRPFSEIDAQFAYDYGEWDRTLATWYEGCWSYYSAEARALGREPSPDMPLVCERFRVVYP